MEIQFTIFNIVTSVIRLLKNAYMQNTKCKISARIVLAAQVLLIRSFGLICRGLLSHHRLSHPLLSGS